ncbi:MAG: hypothetical protein KH119_03670 [Faecalibacterium prausnitzii]|nr:hypothetical protein [Faecalibacterium prausnitzii]
MNAMKKIFAFALAGVMALALLTGCGTGSSASHKSIAKAMEDFDRNFEKNSNITYTSSAEWDAKLQQLAAKPGFETVVKAVYNSDDTILSRIRSNLSGSLTHSGKVVYFYCGKYDKDAGKQAINLNAHSACINTYSGRAPSLADARQIGLITTSFTDTNGEKVKVRFAVVVSDIPTP